jgi:hypothetical protein
MFKRLMGLAFAGALLFSVASAQIMIRIAPPRVQYERRTQRPSRDHVWINGYQRWDGNSYAWAPGRWEKRPNPNARWQGNQWKHDKKNGWVMREGRWR